MKQKIYIASCVFTSRYPELSEKIQNYITEKHHMTIVRCCTPKYKLREFEDKMPEQYREKWCTYADTAVWETCDYAYSICHNCSNIVEEMHPNVQAVSLWELILADEQFEFPNYSGLSVTIQDCWRSRDRLAEQTAIRELLKKMNIKVVELDDNYQNTGFCGASLYQEQPPRNPILAPKHYKESIEGLFIPHTEEEQKRIMEEYCKIYKTQDVVCYCHYCLDGLKMGGVHGMHIAELLFNCGSKYEVF